VRSLKKGASRVISRPESPLAARTMLARTGVGHPASPGSLRRDHNLNRYMVTLEDAAGSGTGGRMRV
jgi:hypothetical protein